MTLPPKTGGVHRPCLCRDGANELETPSAFTMPWVAAKAKVGRSRRPSARSVSEVHAAVASAYEARSSATFPHGRPSVATTYCADWRAADAARRRSRDRPFLRRMGPHGCGAHRAFAQRNVLVGVLPAGDLVATRGQSSTCAGRNRAADTGGSFSPIPNPCELAQRAQIAADRGEKVGNGREDPSSPRPPAWSHEAVANLLALRLVEAAS